MSEVCGTCRYFQYPTSHGTGQCRRHAPDPVLVFQVPFGSTAEAVRVRWPVVDAREWCGEYEKGEPEEGRPGGRVELPVTPAEG